MINEIKELLTAHKEKEEAYSKCEYDAGYWCHAEIQRLEDAEKAFEDALIKLIDSRILELRQ